jgi:hypothetical protein
MHTVVSVSEARAFEALLLILCQGLCPEAGGRRHALG